MMSKERELLQRILDTDPKFLGGRFIAEIQELLAQPEPIKEREVSGKIVSTDDACNWNLTVGALKDYDHVYVNGIRYTEYQPDINTQYLLDQVSRLTAENAMLKEKWLAQPEPEQEPVAWGYKKRVTYKPEGSEEEEIIPLYTAPPKCEPLSDGEITTNTPKLIPIGERLAFHAGIRWAEHQHGIGCGE
jgi:hypothetical protein